jgi:hypothetical protein
MHTWVLFVQVLVPKSWSDFVTGGSVTLGLPQHCCPVLLYCSRDSGLCMSVTCTSLTMVIILQRTGGSVGTHLNPVALLCLCCVQSCEGSHDTSVDGSCDTSYDVSMGSAVDAS